MGFSQRIRTVRLIGVVTRYASRFFLLAALLWPSCLPCAFARFSQANYGSWHQNTYDDENQLTGAEATGYAYYTFAYDGRGRLRKRVGYTPQGGGWTPSSTNYYIYE